MMSQSSLRQWVERTELEIGDTAVLVGNGLCRYKSGPGVSWYDLISKAISEHSAHSNWSADHLNKMSLLQVFDILANEYQGERRIVHEVKHSIADFIRKWKPTLAHRKLVRSAISLNIPILTLNFDRCLIEADDSVRRNHKMVDGRYRPNRTESAAFSWHYPWMCYYSNQDVRNVKRQFAIWHLHGTAEYRQSIRLGLEDYMGLSAKARNWLYSPGGPFRGDRRSEPDWIGVDSWLNMFFSSSLLIYGIGLGRDELFLRWLLIRRMEHLKASNRSTNAITTFVCLRSDLQSEAGIETRLFLEKLGIEIVYGASRKQIYESLPGTYLHRMLRRSNRSSREKPRG